MFIHEYVLKDPFMAELETVVILEPIRYILRAPFLKDQCFDQDPGGSCLAMPGFLAFVQIDELAWIVNLPVHDCG